MGLFDLCGLSENSCLCCVMVAVGAIQTVLQGGTGRIASHSNEFRKYKLKNSYLEYSIFITSAICTRRKNWSVDLVTYSVRASSAIAGLPPNVVWTS